MSIVSSSCSVTQLCWTLWNPMNYQASLSFTITQSLPKFIASVMPSSHLILCHPLLLLPSIFPNIKVFSHESAVHIRWSKYRSFSFSVVPPKSIQGWLPLRLTGLISLLFQESSPAAQFNSINSLALWSFLWSSFDKRMGLLDRP